MADGDDFILASGELEVDIEPRRTSTSLVDTHTVKSRSKLRG